MKVLYQSGMRRMELRNLKIEDICFRADSGYYHKIKKGKGGDPRDFYLSDLLVQEIEVYLKERRFGYLFESRQKDEKGEYKLSFSTINNIIK